MIITKNYNEIHERLFKKINVIEVLSTLKKKKSLHVSFVQK